jgi:hypothetical protein
VPRKIHHSLRTERSQPRQAILPTANQNSLESKFGRLETRRKIKWEKVKIKEGYETTDEKLIKTLEKQIKIVDKLFEGLIREFQSYVNPGCGELVTSLDLNDALVAVNIKERLLRARKELRSTPPQMQTEDKKPSFALLQNARCKCKIDKNILDVSNIRPEVTA